MVNKSDWGAEWFISQGVYTAGPISKLLNDYGSLCRSRGTVPKKVCAYTFYDVQCNLSWDSFYFLSIGDYHICPLRPRQDHGFHQMVRYDGAC